MAVTGLAEALWEAKEVYSKYVVEVRNLEPLLLELIERSDDVMEYSSGGKYWLFPVEFPGGESVGAFREAGVLPGGPTGSLELRGEQGRINVKRVGFAHRVTGTARASIKQGAKGFFDTLDRSIKQKTRITRNDMSRQMWGTGKGILGGGGTAATGGVITAVTGGVPSSLTFGVGTNMSHFSVNMRVDIWNAALTDRRTVSATSTNDETSEDGQGIQISAVNPDARTITFATDVTLGANDPAVGDVVLRENVGITAGTEGNELTGLLQLVQNADITATMQFISFATFPEWQAVVDSNGGVPRNITEDLLQKNVDNVETRSGQDVDTFLTTKGQRRKLIQIGLANVRHESAQLRLGYEKLLYNGKKMFVDRQAILGVLFLGNLAQLGRFIVKDWGSLDVSTGGERVPHFDVTEFAYGTYMNLGIKQANAWGRIMDLQEP